MGFTSPDKIKVMPADSMAVAISVSGAGGLLNEKVAIREARDKEILRLNARITELLERSASALANISKNDLSELKSMSRPPEKLMKALFGVACLMGQHDAATNWSSCKAQLLSPTFFDNLRALSVMGSVDDTRLQELDKIYPLSLLEAEPFVPPTHSMNRAVGLMEIFLSNAVKIRQAYTLMRVYGDEQALTVKLSACSSLHQALREKDAAMISLFLNLPEAVKSRDETGRTPLHIAAERLQASMVESLLSAGAEADAQDKDGFTPLLTCMQTSWASASEYSAVLSLLLTAGADASRKDPLGRNIVYLTAVGCLPAVETGLIPHMPDLPALIRGHTNPRKQTILHKLAQRGHAEYLRLYASKYAKAWEVDVNARDAMGRSALDYAILEVPEEAQALSGAKRMEAQIATLAVLVESLGARVELDEEERREFRSPLLLAVNSGSIQVAQWLMEKGAGAFSPCWRGPVAAEGLEGELDHARGDLKRLHELWPGLTTPFGLMVSKTKDLAMTVLEDKCRTLTLSEVDKRHYRYDLSGLGAYPRQACSSVPVRLQTPLESIIEAASSGDETSRDLMLHPCITTLINAKWRAFARKCWVRDLLLYVALLLLISVLFPLLIIRRPSRAPVWALVLPIIAFVILGLVSEAVGALRDGGRNYVGDYRNLTDHVVYGVVLATCVLMLLDYGPWEARKDLAALSLVLAWLKLLIFFEAPIQTGPFVRMIRGMLWDLVKFSGLYGLVLMGFSLAYYVLLHDTAPHSYGLLRKAFSSTHRVILGDFDFDDFEEQPLARVLFFVHTTLGTILLLSILVAMLSDTFSLVRGGAQAEALLERARTIVRFERELSTQDQKRAYEAIKVVNVVSFETDADAAKNAAAVAQQEMMKQVLDALSAHSRKQEASLEQLREEMEDCSRIGSTVQSIRNDLERVEDSLATLRNNTVGDLHWKLSEVRQRVKALMATRGLKLPPRNEEEQEWGDDETIVEQPQEEEGKEEEGEEGSSTRGRGTRRDVDSDFE